MQVLAWVKYGAIYFAACLAARTGPAKADHSREQYILMAIIGLTDVFAYAANCLGVAFCGATRAALILAATQQVFTAVLSYILLGRRLSSQQVSGVRARTHCSPSCAPHSSPCYHKPLHSCMQTGSYALMCRNMLVALPENSLASAPLCCSENDMSVLLQTCRLQLFASVWLCKDWLRNQPWLLA